jgi:hypothetical protein
MSGLIKSGHFFQYSIQWRYRIIIKRQGTQLLWIDYSLQQRMEHRGFSPQQRKSFFRKLWHQWLPQKVSRMV